MLASSVTLSPRVGPDACCSAGSVALYVPHLDVGGIQIVCLRLAKGFTRAGLKVWLVVHDRNGAMVPEVPSDVDLVDLKATRHLAAAWPLRRFLCEQRPQILLSPFPHCNVIATVAQRLAGSPTRLVLSEHVPVDHALAQFNVWHRILLQGLMGGLYRRADAVVAVSEGVRDTLVRLGVPSSHIRILLNPVLDETFETASRQPVDHPWFQDPTGPIVIGIGRLSIEKDFGTLIRAFERLRRSIPARLVIVGPGDQEARLKALVAELGLAEDVWLTGYLANPSALISKSNVLVSSSRYEGSSLVIVEALGCGCPVVATNTVGADAVLQNGLYGRMVPIGDAEAMAEAIAVTLTTPHDPFPGLQRAANFSVEQSVGAYLSLFSELWKGR
jgi:glycosyltransferase involved in cell wall biosynthesis